jgi:hypothetical protein
MCKLKSILFSSLEYLGRFAYHVGTEFEVLHVVKIHCPSFITLYFHNAESQTVLLQPHLIKYIRQPRRLIS